MYLNFCKIIEIQFVIWIRHKPPVLHILQIQRQHCHSQGITVWKGFVSLTSLKIFLKGFYTGKNFRRNSTHTSYKCTGFKVISQAQPLPHTSLGLIISLSLGTWTCHFSVITGFQVRRHLDSPRRGEDGRGLWRWCGPTPQFSRLGLFYILDSAPLNFDFHEWFFFCIWGK